MNNKECTGKGWTGELPEFDNKQSIDLVVNCFNKQADCSHWTSFLNVLNQYPAHKHTNVIYAFENFGIVDFTVQANKERFLRLTEDWDVEIIVNYRHYHDWVPNLYTGMYKQNVLMYGKGELWPEEGGADLPSFPDSFDDRFELPMLEWMKFLYSRNLLTVYRTFLQMFDNVSVLNIHEGRSFHNWICSLPGADNACAKVSLSTPINENAGSEHAELIIFDLIALAARKTSLVDPSLKREFIRAEVQKHAKTLDANYSLPLKCLSTVQGQELYKLSAMLADVMPVNITVDSSFGAAISGKKLCGVDTEKVLADKNWVDFFLTLWKQK
jgi:hypothetical protein